MKRILFVLAMAGATGSGAAFAQQSPPGSAPSGAETLPAAPPVQEETQPAVPETPKEEPAPCPVTPGSAESGALTPEPTPAPEPAE